jgi:hypothetical protein
MCVCGPGCNLRCQLRQASQATKRTVLASESPGLKFKRLNSYISSTVHSYILYKHAYPSCITGDWELYALHGHVSKQDTVISVSIQLIMRSCII